MPEEGFGRLRGRSSELSELMALLGDPQERLITLTGPAGVGKSRLASAAVAELVDEWDRFVSLNLAEARNPDQGWAEWAAENAQELATRLGDRSALILLDNCDLVARCIASDLSRLLGGNARLTILVTSRVSLDIRAERIVPVRPLPTGPGSAAVELLRDLVRPYYSTGLQLAAGHQHVVDISTETEGIPLAIELAAEAVGPHGPGPVLEGLRAGTFMENRRLIDVPERHRGMGSALAWGEPALSDADLRLVRDLSVFEGVIDVAAVQRLTGLGREAACSGVESLVHKSLLVSAADGKDELVFRLPRMVRAHFGRQLALDSDRLARVRDLRDRHVREFASGEALMSFAAVRARLDRVADRLPDVRAAVRHLRERGAHTEALRVLTDLEGYLLAYRLAPELAAEIEEAADAARRAGGEVSTVSHGLLVLVCRRLAWGDHDGAAEALREVSAVGADVPVVMARAAALRAELLLHQQRFAEAESEARAAALELEALGEPLLAALARATLATVEARNGVPDADRPLRRTVEMLHETPGCSVVEAAALIALSRVCRLRGRPSEAHQAASRAMRLLGDGGDPQEVAGAVGSALLVSRVEDEGEQLAAARVLTDLEALRETYGLCAGEEAEPLRELEGRLTEALGPRVLEGLRGRALHTSIGETLHAALALPASGPMRPEVTGPAPYGFTSRQHEIALLVAEGLTNRQIGRRLEISEWTVVNHLRQVMQKSGCSSRVHVARLMREHGR